MAPRQCRKIVVDGAVVGIICGSGPRKCSTPGCTRRAELLCDWPVLKGKRRVTCDRPICAACAYRHAPDVDYCAAHGREQEAKA